jgi:hypothetical protein
LKLALGLTEVRGDLVIPAPVDRIEDLPMLGLAVRSDKQGPIGAHRVLILVQGTGVSELVPIGSAPTLQEASYQVFSSKVKCLLSSGENFIDLVGYCDFSAMLQ